MWGLNVGFKVILTTNLPLGGVLISESDDLLPAGIKTFTGDVELRRFWVGGDEGAIVSSGTGEL